MLKCLQFSRYQVYVLFTKTGLHQTNIVFNMEVQKGNTNKNFVVKPFGVQLEQFVSLVALQAAS